MHGDILRAHPLGAEVAVIEPDGHQLAVERILAAADEKVAFGLLFGQGIVCDGIDIVVDLLRQHGAPQRVRRGLRKQGS